jgi:hypothetical protein
MSGEIRGRVEGSGSFVIDDDKQAILRSRGEHLLHHVLIKKLRPIDTNGVIFFSRPNIEEVNPIGLEQVLDLLGRYHHALILLPG